MSIHAYPDVHAGAFTSFARATSEATKKVALFLFSIAVLLAGATAKVQAQSALDGFAPNANGAIRVVVAQPDGKILIGGDFTTLSANDGTTLTRNRIARLNPDGTLDTAFDPNANDSILSIALKDGKILAGGNFTSIGGQSRNRIARLNATTGSADSFDPDANGAVLSIAVRTHGRILAGGNFTSIGGQTRNRIARLDPGTGLADSFDPNANGAVESIVVRANGKILAGGNFTSIGGQTRKRIAQLDANTGLADSFDPNANNRVLSIAVQADGKVLAGGAFTSIGGETRNRIARLDTTTGLADSFDPNANNRVLSIALQTDGKILGGGQFTSIGGQTRYNIARLETDGRLDRTLDVSIDGTLSQTYLITTAVQPDGKILIGGGFTSVLGVARNGFARLNTDGTLDTAFDPNPSGVGFAEVDAIAVQADGKILVGGCFNMIGGQPRNNIARLDATTGAADSFDPNAEDTTGGLPCVYGITVQADGKILVVGFFNSIGGQPRYSIARLDPATGLADSFDPNPNNDYGFVYSIELQPDGKILVGGFFTQIGGQARNRIARLDATTGLADSFNPNAQGVVYSIAVQPDGKILVGGFYNRIGERKRRNIARLDPTTGLADSFNPTADLFVFSLAVQGDGKILAGGLFTKIGGKIRPSLARLDGTTGSADSFNPKVGGQVNGFGVQADGKILVGGVFESIGNEPRNFFARLSNDTAALQNLAVTQTTITWTRGGSSPQFTRVTFESSTDNVNYSTVGNGTAAGNTWTLTGLNLPTGQNIYIRARGFHSAGLYNGSESVTESVRNAFIAEHATSNSHAETNTN